MPKRPSDPFRLLGFFIGSERRRVGLTQREVAARLGQSRVGYRVSNVVRASALTWWSCSSWRM